MPSTPEGSAVSPAPEDEGPFVVKNERLSGQGSFVFDYVVENIAKQPEIAAAYQRFSTTAKRVIDDEQLDAFLAHCR